MRSFHLDIYHNLEDYLNFHFKLDFNSVNTFYTSSNVYCRGSQRSVLEGRCPAEFNPNSNQTHLKQLIKFLLGILETSRQVCWGKLELNSAGHRSLQDQVWWPLVYFVLLTIIKSGCTDYRHFTSGMISTQFQDDFQCSRHRTWALCYQEPSTRSHIRTCWSVKQVSTPHLTLLWQWCREKDVVWLPL